MKNLKEFIFGLLSTIASILIVFGALSISITEGMVFVPTTISSPPQTTEFDLSTLLPAKTEALKTPEISSIITVTPVSVNTCNYPKNWIPYTIQIGDSLDDLAAEHNLSKTKLMEANCLLSDKLMTGSELYVPPLPPTKTPKPTQTKKPSATVQAGCQRPWGWILYTIKSGENLFRIGLRYNVTAEELRRANCLASSDRIVAGTTIYVPNVPTIAPLPSNTPTERPPDPTSTPEPTTAPTAASTETSAPTLTPTNTLVPSETPTEMPSETPTLTPTETLTETVPPPVEPPTATATVVETLAEAQSPTTEAEPTPEP